MGTLPVPPPVRAPRDDGAILAIPALADAPVLIAANRRQVDDAWSRRRSLARREALDAALQYHAENGEPVPEISGDSLLLAGHQPELFHPGVWVKNFALNALARRGGSIPLNLVIDTDIAKSAAIPMPVLSSAEPVSSIHPDTDDSFTPLPRLERTHNALARLGRVAFDLGSGDAPYEERRVADEGLFATFPERVRKLQHNWKFDPLLRGFWSEAVRQASRTSLVGERFAAARRLLERRWGCTNLEVPMSRICATNSFARFAGHLFSHLHEFHRAHNQALAEYRARHGITSRNRPVAELQRDGDWLEAPLWAWRSPAERRLRLFVRPGPTGFELRAGNEAWPTLPLDPDACASEWRRLNGDGLKIRSRALTTTMFARLYLGDLFIHGIGGAKYDELTDEIIRRYYGFEPPHFMILSATLLLPFDRWATTDATVQHLSQQRRDLWYNPQRHLNVSAASPTEVAQLVAEKQQWTVQGSGKRVAGLAGYRAIRRINRELRQRVRQRHLDVSQELQTAQRQLEANEVLGRRDYPFCLYPEETLKPFCQKFNL